MITSSLTDYIRTAEGVRNFDGYVDSHYPQKPNILLGFGLVSKSEGLSEFIPIEIFNMILVAEEIRRKVAPEGAKVHIIIADNLARECQHDSCEVSHVERMIKKYQHKITNIIKNLDVEQHCVLHMGSTILASQEYTDIRAQLENPKQPSPVYKKDTRDLLKENGRYKGCRNYFFDQITMMRYLYQFHDCGVKISWSRNGTPKNIRQSTSFDEAHFDRFYRELCQEDTMSFVYTEPGYVANSDDSVVCPYNAPKIEGVERVSLHHKAPFPNYPVNEKLAKSVSNNASFVLSTLLQKEAKHSAEAFSFEDNVCFLRQFARKPEKNKVVQPLNESDYIAFSQLSLQKIKVPS